MVEVDLSTIIFILVACLSASSRYAIADDSSSLRARTDLPSAPAGPSPYPKDPASWPAKGAIRVFDWMSQNRRAFWVEREAKRGAVVFAGDSLIGGWKTLEKDFPGMKVANRGIGGDVSRGLVFRWQEDVLDLDPKAVIILIGTNDLSAQQATDDTVANIALLLDAASRHRDSLPVILCTLPPRSNPKAPIINATLLELNRKIEALGASRRNVTVLDLHRMFATAEGGPNERYFQNDLLHLNAAAYSRWHDEIIHKFEVLNVR